MIRLKKVQDIRGNVSDVELPNELNLEINAEGLTLLPGIIDTHVHFRQPGHDYKEDWGSGAQAAIAGGVTTVFDMPNNNPPCYSYENLMKKKKLIDKKLKSVDIPLRYHLYLGADKNHFDEIPKCRQDVIGIKVFMGCSTGSLLMDADEDLERVFSVAAEQGLIISVHAEDEAIIRANRSKYQGVCSDVSVHSKIRHREAAVSATSKAINLAKKYNTRLCILHMSTSDEVELVRQGKADGVKVYAEAAPHHLFLDESDYARNGTKVQMNPPLRTESDRLALWDGINRGIIDFLGTDHAPHTLDEKLSPYGEAPSGVPSIELILPLMLDAADKGLVSLHRIVELTSTRAKEVFRLEPNHDAVLVDLNLEKMVDDAELKTKCQWSPYHGRMLKGWPVCTILKDNLYEVEEISCHKL